MFEVTDNTIYITRGDKGTIDFSIKNFTFQKGDIIKFSVYGKKQLDKAPLLRKEILVDDISSIVSINLTSEDTKSIGPIINTASEFWYEIEINNNQTPLGYDKDGPKLLILYPEGADNNDNNE